MKLQFTKMDALGNDFIMVDCLDGEDRSGLMPLNARGLCDRIRGVGANGVICVLPPAIEGADFRMRIFNADGSEAEMCGNGVRCLGEYLRVTGRFMEKFVIDTLGGAVEVDFTGVDGVSGAGQYRVNMGYPRLFPDDIPVIRVDLADVDFVMKEVTALDRTFRVTAVSMGNPHAVIYDEDLSDELVLKYGPAVQGSPFFPKGVNVEFVKIISANEIRMRVYERGCGETLACGTGACAAVVAGVVNGMHDSDVTVHLPGGDMRIEWSGEKDSPVYMSGPARVVYTGTVYEYDIY